MGDESSPPEALHVGFTGTRHGMSQAQLGQVYLLLRRLAQRGTLVCHHGDCVGADAQFHGLALDFTRRVVIHPPSVHDLRAFCTSDEHRAPRSYRERDRAIVEESGVMIAAPLEAVRQRKGGTWYTVGQALKSGKPLALVLPDGDRAMVLYDGAPWPG